MGRVVARPENGVRLDDIAHVVQSILRCDQRNVAGTVHCSEFACFDRTLSSESLVSAAVPLSTVGNGIDFIPEICVEVGYMKELIGGSTLISSCYLSIKLINIVVILGEVRLLPDP